MKTLKMIITLAIPLLFFVALHAEEEKSRSADDHPRAEAPASEEATEKEEREEPSREEHEEHEEEEEGEEEASSSSGPGNAVTQADPEKGIQLSEKALRTLEVRLAPAPQDGLFTPQSLVHFKDETGVYRLRDGWFKLIEGEAEPQGDRVLFTPERREDLRRGDQIVIHGVPLLRVAELDVFGGADADHAH